MNGITGIEDRLQDEVSDTIMKMTEARKKAEGCEASNFSSPGEARFDTVLHSQVAYLASLYIEKLKYLKSFKTKSSTIIGCLEGFCHPQKAHKHSGPPQHARQAGMKVWMLTGDKTATWQTRVPRKILAKLEGHRIVLL